MGVSSFKKPRISAAARLLSNAARSNKSSVNFAKTGVSCVLIASEINAPSSAAVASVCLTAGSVIYYCGPHWKQPGGGRNTRLFKRADALKR